MTVVSFVDCDVKRSNPKFITEKVMNAISTVGNAQLPQFYIVGVHKPIFHLYQNLRIMFCSHLSPSNEFISATYGTSST